MLDLDDGPFTDKSPLCSFAALGSVVIRLFFCVMRLFFHVDVKDCNAFNFDFKWTTTATSIDVITKRNIVVPMNIRVQTLTETETDTFDYYVFLETHNFKNTKFFSNVLSFLNVFVVL